MIQLYDNEIFLWNNFSLFCVYNSLSIAFQKLLKKYIERTMSFFVFVRHDFYSIYYHIFVAYFKYVYLLK